MYRNSSHDYDICIIHLDKEVSGRGIAIIRLPSYTQAKVLVSFGEKVTVSGFGKTNDAVTSNTQLIYTDVTIMYTNENAGNTLRNLLPGCFAQTAPTVLPFATKTLAARSPSLNLTE
ncbi:Hypothetical predicted protein [Cloeon dipterum]|uniref:Peptidase S1 domain-containing protein n=1 Tax=Cloeon dipterum TaxID=197152 RepID=A0A8S1CXK7_9INSE|nr:Hypothetical predicted protein [Cloeon dipterum]